MFDYSLTQDVQTQQGTLWDPKPLSPVSPGVLTPFSHSVLAEIIRRGWFTYYDRLGFEPTPGAQLIRSHCGRAYLNLSLSAQLDATHAAIEPPAVRINGAARAAAPWERPGFLGGLRALRNGRALRTVLEELDTQIDAVTQRARDWHAKTQELRWTQAEILQVMEEIERIGVESATAFFAARHNLEGTHNQLLWAMQKRAPFPQNLARLQQVWTSDAVDPGGQLIECVMIDALRQLADVWQQTAADHKGGPAGQEDTASFTEWSTTLPASPFRTELAAFLERFGHRALAEGEIAQPRWWDDPTAVVRSMTMLAASAPLVPPPRLPAERAYERVLEVVAADAQKPVRQWLEQLPGLMRLQSRALHAFAYVLAGTRHWAVAASREAMTDGRLTAADDVFFYELEEVKEMMTGEWNISAIDEIQAEAAQRKARHDAFQQERPADLLIDDTTADSERPLHLGAVTRVSGPLMRLSLQCADPFPAAVDRNAILHLTSVDSGCAILLPLGAGFIIDHGAPLDPVVAAACAWQKPLVLSMDAQCSPGQGYETVTIDGSTQG